MDNSNKIDRPMMWFQTKDSDILSMLLRWPMHVNLVGIVEWWLSNWHMTTTSGYRPGDLGVHGTIPFRGLDVRSWDHRHPEAIEIKANKQWQYDPKRPEKKVCILHDVGGGLHFHLQVHKNTVRRKAGMIY